MGIKDSFNEPDDESPFFWKGTGYVIAEGDGSDTPRNPIGFIWDTKDNISPSQSAGFGFTGTDQLSKSDRPYGRASPVENAPRQASGFRQHFMNQVWPNRDGAGALIIAAVISAVAFQNQVGDFTEDISSPADAFKKAMIVAGGTNTARTKDFFFYRDSAAMNPEQRAEMQKTARFLNLHNDIQVEIAACGAGDVMNLARASEARRTLVQDFGVDAYQVQKITVNGAVCDLKKSPVHAVQLAMKRVPDASI